MGQMEKMYGRYANAYLERAAGGPMVTVAIPCLNEAVTIAKVVEDFNRALPYTWVDIVVYDNGSTDGSPELAARAGARVRFVPARGKGNVVRRILADFDGDALLLVDGDDTYPAESAMRLLVPVLDGRDEMTVGDRFLNGGFQRESRAAGHAAGNAVASIGMAGAFGYRTTDGSSLDVMSGYRALSHDAVCQLRGSLRASGFEVETEIAAFAAMHSWRVESVPIEYRERPCGSYSKISDVPDAARIAATAAREFARYRPLYAAAGAAALVAACGAVFGRNRAARVAARVSSAALLAVGADAQRREKARSSDN